MTQLIPLGDIAEIFNGKTPSKSEKRDRGHPILKIKDVTSNFEFKGSFESFVDEEFYKRYSNKRIKKGDTLILNAAHNADYVGSKQFRACENVDGVIATGEWLIVRALSDKACNSYINNWLKSGEARFRIRDLVKGIHLYPKDVARLKIPLPPLEEQKRIAAILDKADSLRRKRQQAIDLTDQLLRSVFLDMFGDPVTNPKGFEVKPFSECINGITGGWSTSGQARPAKDNEMGVLKISAVTSGQYVSSENKAVEIVPKNKKLIIPKKGDLLFSRANTRELVAAMCIVDRDTENLFLPDKLWRIDLLMKQATNEYIKFLFAHPEFRNGLCKKATGTSGSMLNISKTKLMDHEIPLPPISLQKKFSVFFYKLQKQREDYTVALEHNVDLFSSLTQQAFNGELTNQTEAA